MTPTRCSGSRRRATDDGYAMAALLVALAVMSVVASSAMPVWQQMAQREREAELIFRGEQYARAIGLFQRKMGPGTLPPNLDLLVQQRFLRKEYLDPITGDEFQPLYANQPAASNRSGIGQTGEPQGAAPRQAVPPIGVGGIVGVVSKSKDASIREYLSRNRYDQWTFMHTVTSQAPGAPTGSEEPGGPGGAAGAGPNSAPGQPRDMPTGTPTPGLGRPQRGNPQSGSAPQGQSTIPPTPAPPQTR